MPFPRLCPSTRTKKVQFNYFFKKQENRKTCNNLKAISLVSHVKSETLNKQSYLPPQVDTTIWDRLTEQLPSLKAVLLDQNFIRCFIILGPKPFSVPCFQLAWQRNLYKYHSRKKYSLEGVLVYQVVWEPMRCVSCFSQYCTSIQGEEQYS